MANDAELPQWVVFNAAGKRFIGQIDKPTFLKFPL